MKWSILIPWVILLLITTLSAIGVVYARHMNRQLFHQLEQLERERDNLNIEFGQLQLERATWADNDRVEKIATTQLHMIFPTPDNTRIVRQPTPNTPIVEHAP